jgi:hypothetical protein
MTTKAIDLASVNSIRWVCPDCGTTRDFELPSRRPLADEALCTGCVRPIPNSAVTLLEGLSLNLEELAVRRVNLQLAVRAVSDEREDPLVMIAELVSCKMICPDDLACEQVRTATLHGGRLDGGVACRHHDRVGHSALDGLYKSVEAVLASGYAEHNIGLLLRDWSDPPAPPYGQGVE